jgi:hypothetical protein
MSVILATQKAEIERIAVQGQHGKKFYETPPISNNGWVQLCVPVVPAMWGSTNRRLCVKSD